MPEVPPETEAVVDSTETQNRRSTVKSEVV